ncbi:hypothetical protein AAE478_002370 [Parahypoxylon ruwenzoriense]
MALGRESNGSINASSGPPAAADHNGTTLLSTEDDEISLDSCTEESQSPSDVSMSGSDDEDEHNPTLSAIDGNTAIQRPSLDPIVAMQQVHNIPKKRKPLESIDIEPDPAISVKRAKLDKNGRDALPSAAGRLSDKSLLPAEIWHRIFTFIPPRTLGNLLCTNKLFNVYLDSSSLYQCKPPAALSQTSTPPLKPDTIWQLSRRRFWQRMPSPLQQKTELDMWRLACGKRCQFCGRPDSESPQSPEDQRYYKTQCIWAFALRCCEPCLKKKTVKEIDLLLSSLVPSVLMSALPFVLVTGDMRTISPDALQRGLVRSDVQVTKMYFSEHVERLKQEFLSVKSMGGATAEEWLKGLETRGKKLLNDSIRWEKWMSVGGIVQMQTQPSPDSVPSEAPPNKSEPLSRTLSSFQHSIQNISSRSRTREEVLELKAIRRAEIERRAMELDPPLPAGILAQIPSFQAAIQIISPLDDNAWDLLKPRLLAQRGAAEQREQQEHEVSTNPHALERSEERRHTNGNSMATKQLIDKTWDEFQAPLRARISAFADEITRDDWDDGQKVNMENSAQFAVDVLLYARKRFYAEVAEDTAVACATGQKRVEDSPEGPFTRKLTLENMKWLFDVKIKPHTEAYRKDIFFCNGCEANFKAYGFEGVIQHYAAKHTNTLSLGSIVVYWRAEWPEVPPFKPDPQVIKVTHLSATSSYGSLQPWNNVDAVHHNFGPSPLASNPTPFQASPSYATMPASIYGHPSYESSALPQTPSGQSSPYVSGRLGYGSPYPLSSSYTTYDPHGTAYSSPQVPFPTGVHTGPAMLDVHHGHNCNAHQRNSQLNLQPSQGSNLAGRYYAQLEYVARNSRELWSSTAGLKELPGSIRVHVVIHYVVQRFRSLFAESPPLATFIDGLSNNKEMRPVRNVNGLVCKACYLGLGNGTLADRGRRTFSLPQLVNHFQQRHVEQPQAVGALSLDWTVDMVHTPDLSVIFSLRNSANMDSQKWYLVSGAFSLTQRPNGCPQGANDPNPRVAWAHGSGSANASIQLAGQQQAYCAPVSHFPTRYNSLPQSTIPGNDPDNSTTQHDSSQATLFNQKLNLDQSTTLRTSPSMTGRKPHAGDSDWAPPETWQRPIETKPKLGKGDSSNDHRNTPSRAFKSRKNGGVSASISMKSQEPSQEDLVAEEERRQEEKIRAMWAADRREIARLASTNQRAVDIEESTMPKAISKVESLDLNHSAQSAQGAKPSADSTQIQGSRQALFFQEREDDDLMAGLQSQLDQQVSSEHAGYRPRRNSETSHEKPLLSYDGRPASRQYSPIAQEHPYTQIRAETPIYVQCESRSHSNKYRERSPILHSINPTSGPTQISAAPDASLYERFPRQEYYPVHSDDPRVHQAASQYAEAYELIRVRDTQGEYFIRRQIRLDPEPAYAAFDNRRASYRDATLQYRAYEQDVYSSSRPAHESISRAGVPFRQHKHGPSPMPEGRVKNQPCESFSSNGPAAYEGYDPRFPAAPPTSSIARRAQYQ